MVVFKFFCFVFDFQQFNYDGPRVTFCMLTLLGAL